jgi:hypothetical protein
MATSVPPTTNDFDRELRTLFQEAQAQGKSSVTVTAGDLHRRLGGYPGTTNHRMPIACQSMRKAMAGADKVISAPPRGKGASLKIEYRLPRP